MRIQTTARLGATVLATALAVTPAVVGASASAAARPGAAFGPARPAIVGKTIAKNKISAGYQVKAAKITDVSVTETVPRILSCGRTEFSGMVPVVALYGKGYFAGAGAEAVCDDGTRTYQVGINFNGSEGKVLTVKPEDKLTLSVVVTATGTGVKVDDVTTKKAVSQTGPHGTATETFVGDESLVDDSTGAQLPIPKFSNHTFTRTEVDGKAIGKAKNRTEYEMVVHGTVLVTPGPLTAEGTAFKMIFKHAG